MKNILIFISLLLPFCYFSCGTIKLLPINGKKSITLISECGEVYIQISKYGKGYLMEQTFTGNNFTITPDSLKVDLLSKGNYYSEMEIHLVENDLSSPKEFIYIQSEEKLTTKFYFEIPDNKTLRILRNREFLYILPGKYITCNGEAVITDTLIVDLHPPKNWTLEK